MSLKGYALILSGICIIIFLLQVIFPSFTDYIVLNSSAWTEPWRFVTALFAHGGMPHLLYNLFALALFGTLLEGLVGEKKFILVFFVTGIIANVISLLFYPSSLGASGAIFGVIGAAVVVRPTLVVWAYGLPMPLFVACFLWALGDLIGLFVPSNVGHIAHLSGLALGLIYGAFLRKPQPKIRHNSLILDEGIMRSWEDRYVR